MKKMLISTICSLVLTNAAVASVQQNMPTNAPLNVSFVQSATTSQFSKLDTANGVYQLTLKNVSPRVTYFSDRPNRVIGQFSIPQYLTKWRQGKDNFNVDAPNAVLSAAFHDAKNQDQFINVFVELSKPVYTPGKNVITYQAKLLNNNRQPLPSQELHHAVLFIDEACLSCVG